MTAEHSLLLKFFGFFRKKIGNCLQVFRFISIFAPKNWLLTGVSMSWSEN